MAEPLFKFLANGSTGRFSGFGWPAAGEWVNAEGSLEPCVSGLHVCRTQDLPYWLDDELWEVEVAGDRVEHLEKLVVERARLTTRVEAWPRPLASELADDCLGVVRRLAARELELSGDPDAPALADGDDLAAAQRARELTEGDAPTRTASAGRLLGLLADAGGYVADRDSLGAAMVGRYLAYIAAYAADRASPGDRLAPGATAFSEERRRQAEFLAKAL